MRRWPALDLSPAAPLPGPPADWRDLLAAALDGLAPTAILEGDSSWRAFFATTAERDRAAEALSVAAPWVSVSALEVEDEDWARRSQEDLRPVRVGRVVIAPPWAAGAASGPDTVEVVIQPSMGFGTGHHASTRLCTALLQALDLRGRSVLDVGTGSGVLAIVAARLGAARVEGVDDDADALAAAAENLELNQLSGRVALRAGDFRGLAPTPADIVLANLTGALVVRSAGLLAAATRPGGWLIVSGVTLDEEAQVREAFEPALRLEARQAEDEWVGLRFAAPAGVHRAGDSRMEPGGSSDASRPGSKGAATRPRR